MRVHRFRVLWSLSVLFVFIGTLLFVLTGDEAGSAQSEESAKKSENVAVETKSEEKNSEKATESEAEKKTEAAKKQAAHAPRRSMASASTGCLLDENAIEDLRQKRLEVEARERELASKEAELKAAKLALEEELKKITAVREDILKLQALQKKDQEEKVAKLVEAFESMSPKSASQLLASVDEALAVEAMGKISTQKLAKIMNVMEPGPLTRLTERLAGVAQAKQWASKGALAATDSSKKGGDKNDGQYQSHASTPAEPAAEPLREPASPNQARGTK